MLGSKKCFVGLGFSLLVLVFVTLVVAQFSSSNSKSNQVLIRERLLTLHDELYAVDVVSSGQGWAVGKFGVILHTANCGKSWSRQKSGTTKALTSVSFADERHGFAVGGGGTILTTTDTGRSWQLKNSGTKGHLLGVHALSDKAAFAVGAFGTVLSTHDGGVNWTKHKLPWQELLPSVMLEVGDVEPNLNTIHFANSKQGWLGGEFGLILYTRNGGETWITQRAGSHFPQIAAIEFRDASNGWAVGQKGTLLKTSDGGKIWQPIGIDGQRDLYGISLAEKIVVIVGAGVMLKTSNGGLDWAPVVSPPVNIWFSGVAISGGIALVVGQSGTIQTIGLSQVDSGEPTTEKLAP